MTMMVMIMIIIVNNYFQRVMGSKPRRAGKIEAYKALLQWALLGCACCANSVLPYNILYRSIGLLVSLL